MSIAELFSHMFAPPEPSGGEELPRPKARQIRPLGHFREFTLPRRYQRGGGAAPRRNAGVRQALRGIIPFTGENIP
ncbi:MAG TPA: hypothetical protein VFF91_02290 [Pseudoxanthomonas sp.]|nr:hypothetical protein [Pseudoxanthomonas sp.]